MIQYKLSCENDHKFEAWFQSSAAYDAQVKDGHVTCPICTTSKVEKALMAPAVPKKSNASSRAVEPAAKSMSLSSGHPEQAELQKKLKELRAKVLEDADYVGDKFAEEARKIHDEETESRSIYGEATPDEVSGLVEDGIDFMPVPTLPDEHN